MQAVAKALGSTNEVLDIHDGEMMPTLENRRTITRLIREWNADIVISNRPNDYHPDHRYTSILVQDSAYMVGVPFFTPNVPQLRRTRCSSTPPTASSGRTRSGGCRGGDRRGDGADARRAAADGVADPRRRRRRQREPLSAERPGRAEEARQAGSHEPRPPVRAAGNQFRETLIKFYGAGEGKTIKYAQGFEICEYGRTPQMDELRKLFPF